MFGNGSRPGIIGMVLTIALISSPASAVPGSLPPAPAHSGADARSLYLPGELVVKLSLEAGRSVAAGGSSSFRELPSLEQLNERYLVLRVHRLFPQTSSAGPSVRYRLADIYSLIVPESTRRRRGRIRAR